ncbi:KAT8 regulatory NSL complex subunit 1-like protein isoform X2 [Callorhinchus milii]|uniref:KAT8 regulatory NSL complex subunit 1-like protein isoform X2 n=1 Tax=Callorhinchus milii TaxID=7868 RepID=UPI00045719B0|nr:KAT8 regulatory NSL complex subunit 1-like protein isoform X2 [Callorhinchus milii]|eukprot:gi/632964276/ref/XP_007898321.1/ PREDICTED: KAT8 regulatory NSL complex subunit 1-like protein isoform X2 [Callorhinchus milii]
MATMAPALTETATEGHGFQLSSSSLPSSSIELDTFVHKSDTATEQQKLNGDCETQSAWSQLTYPHTAHGLNTDAKDLKHLPYGSAIIHSSIPNNTALLTSTSSLLDILSLNYNLTSRKKLFNKDTPAILTKNNICYDRIKSTSASNVNKKYILPEANLSRNKNGTKDLRGQKNSPLKSKGMLSATSKMHLACDSASVNLYASGGTSATEQAEFRPSKINSTSSAPAVHIRQKGNLLNGARQSVLQRKEERLLSHSTSAREAEMNTQLLQCLGRQQELAKKASRLRKRLQEFQAKHVEYHVKHEMQKLVEYKHQSQEALHGSVRHLDDVFNSSENKPAVIAEIKPDNSGQTGLIPNLDNCELYKYTSYSKALLSHVEENVDSDATGSSSDGDSDSEEISLKRSVSESEWRWNMDRTGIASRWTWLQAQISELEYRIRQINDIYRHIRATKGMVILEESQPSKDILKKQKCLTEAGALLNATGDNKTSIEKKDSTPECNLEMSPSSPSLLLRNIDKQPCRRLDGIKCSILGGDESSSSNSSVSEERFSKKKHLDRTAQRLLSVDDTCASARTRPLRTWHKRRLFSSVYNGSRKATAMQCKCSWPTFCKICGFNMAIDSMTMTLEEQVALLDPCFHPVLSFHCDVPLNIHLQAVFYKEEWNNRPIPLFMNELKSSLSNNTPCKPHTCDDNLVLARCNGTKDSYAKVPKQHWNESPSAAKTPTEGLRKSFREIKKRHSNEKTAVVSKRHCGPENSSESPSASSMRHIQTPVPVQQTPCSSPIDISTPRSTPSHRPFSQMKDNLLRQKQQSEFCYDIDNIVIPMSLVATSKIEKLQYKEIITPSWRIVDMKPLHSREKELENTSDEAFASRHKNYEEREQARWFLWEQSRCHRRSNRISFSKNTDGHLTSPLPPASSDSENQFNPCSSVHCVSEITQSEETYYLSLEGVHDQMIECPWNCRTFPLSDKDIIALTQEDSIPCGPLQISKSCFASPSLDTAAYNLSSCVTPPSVPSPSTGQVNAGAIQEEIAQQGEYRVNHRSHITKKQWR